MTGTTAALIVAGGRGLRAGSGLPKQYRSLGGRPVLQRTLELFASHPGIDRVLCVIGAEDRGAYAACAPKSGAATILPPAEGGADRQASVLAGLTRLADDAPDNVLIHDAVRPFATPALVDRVIAALDGAEAALPVLPVTSTLKAVADGRVTATVPRSGLFAAETPQGFRFAPILDAHRRAAAAGLSLTDDAGVAEWAGIAVATVAGEPGNVKLTTAEEIDAAERRLTGEAALALGDVRVGLGYDVHALGPGHEVTLGGVAIPHMRGLVGHSDADAALHAVTDAILGALGEGDIGAHFPSSDMAWKDAASDRFVRFAAERVAARGGRIAHIDVVIVAEAPKIGPHREAMRARIADICGISVDRVGVKATTNENLGFIGRSEGIAATATATVRLPFAP